MIYFDENGLFLYGKFDYEKAKLSAKNCPHFREDCDDDEIVSSKDEQTCYNCLYRRWTKESFTCYKN